MAASLPTRVLSHQQRVLHLYKEALRMTQSYYFERFDKHKDEKDLRIAKRLVEDGEKELFEKQHPQRVRFSNSPGGVAYGREPHMADWLLDVWHPYEKAAFPEYFARREIRKKEFIERWEKKYGPAESDHH